MEVGLHFVSRTREVLAFHGCSTEGLAGSVRQRPKQIQWIQPKSKFSGLSFRVPFSLQVPSWMQPIKNLPGDLRRKMGSEQGFSFFKRGEAIFLSQRFHFPGMGRCQVGTSLQNPAENGWLPPAEKWGPVAEKLGAEPLPLDPLLG